MGNFDDVMERLALFWKNRNHENFIAANFLFFLFSASIFGPLYFYHALAATTDFGPPEPLTCRSLYWQTGGCGIVFLAMALFSFSNCF